LVEYSPTGGPNQRQLAAGLTFFHVQRMTNNVLFKAAGARGADAVTLVV